MLSVICRGCHLLTALDTTPISVISLPEFEAGDSPSAYLCVQKRADGVRRHKYKQNTISFAERPSGVSKRQYVAMFRSISGSR